MSDPEVASARAELLGVLETLGEIAVLVTKEQSRTANTSTSANGVATYGSLSEAG